MQTDYKAINYLTTNLINKQQYVGDTLIKNEKQNPIGHGLSILKAFKDFGKDNFKTEILCYCLSKTEAFNNQEMFIKLFNTLEPNGYNKSPKGGSCGIGSINVGVNNPMYGKHRIGKDAPMYGKKHTNNTKQIISKILVGKPKSEEHKKHLKENHPDFSGSNNSMYGKQHSIETKIKMSDAKKGKIRGHYKLKII